MNGYCTYTVVATMPDGEERDVPCAKPRVGEVTGPGMRVVVCKRHADKVARAMLREPQQGLELKMDEGATE